MKKELICIECPTGCKLIVDIKNNQLLDIKGYKCPKGKQYGEEETKDPKRVLTTTVRTISSELKMLPVKTSGPIPKDKIAQAMLEIKKIRIRKKVPIGGIVVKDLLNLGVNLIATRDSF